MVVGAVQGIQGLERGQESARTHAHHRIRAICPHSLFPTTPPFGPNKTEKAFVKSKKKTGKKEEKLVREVKASNVFPSFPLSKKQSHFHIRFQHHLTMGVEAEQKATTKALLKKQ